jgi:hypothetical protein
MSFGSVLDYAIDGLILGDIYALLAVGLALIFGVSHPINFAHGIGLYGRRVYRLGVPVLPARTAAGDYPHCPGWMRRTGRRHRAGRAAPVGRHRTHRTPARHHRHRPSAGPAYANPGQSRPAVAAKRLAQIGAGRSAAAPSGHSTS